MSPAERVRAQKDARMEAERQRWQVIERECWARMVEVDRFAREVFGCGIPFPAEYVYMLDPLPAADANGQTTLKLDTA